MNISEFNPSIYPKSPKQASANIQNSHHLKSYNILNLNATFNQDKISFSQSMNEPLVSVIMPVYNVEKYLNKALDSLKNQTLKNIEIICVDGGSSDSSVEILKKYAQEDNRFHVITQENQGPGMARNRALQLAKGDYIAFLDPDDWIDKEAYEILYKQAKSQNSDIVVFNYKTHDEKNKKINEISLQNIIEDTYTLSNDKTFTWRDIKSKEFYGLYYTSWNKFYNKNFLEKNDIKFAPYYISEDNPFVIGATLSADKISYCDKHLYNYLLREGSLVHRYTNKNFCVFDICNIVKKIIEEKGLDEEIAQDYLDYASDLIVYQYQRVCPDSRKEFEEMCTKKLDKKLAEKALTEIKKITDIEKQKKQQSFLEKIFSITTEEEFGIEHKFLTLLGIKLQIK